MFEPLYTAACEQIMPDEALCARVLDAMHAEAEKTAVVPLPAARNTAHPPRRLAMLVACAAVALTAAVIALTIARQPAPPKQSGEPVTAGTSAPAVPTSSGQNGASASSTTTEQTPTTDEGASAIATTDTTATVDPANSATPTTPPNGSGRPTMPEAQPPQTADGYADIYAYLTQWTTTPTTQRLTTARPSMSTGHDTDVSGTTTESPTLSPGTAPSIDAETSNPTTTTHSMAIPIEPTPPDGMIGYGEPADSPLSPYGGHAVNEDGNTCQQTGRNGNILYFLSSRSLLIYQLDGAASSLLCSLPLDLQGTVQTEGLLVSGDRLAVIYTRTAYNGSKKSYTTFVRLYDVSAPAAPRRIGEFGQDGYYRAARAADGVLYLISYHTPVNTPNSAAPATFIPSVYQNGISRTLAANDITIANAVTHNGFTVMTALSMDENGHFLSEKALFGQKNSRICVTDSAVMILSNHYTQTGGGSSAPVMDATSFTFAGGAITARAVITLRGESDYVQVGAHNGLFYIACSRTGADDPRPTLYVLNSAMVLTGKLEGLPSSLFTGMVFSGDRLCLCQKFEITTIDIHDPTTPRLIDRLTQTGAIERIYPCEDGLLLAKIGYVYHTALSVINADDGTILHELNHDALLNFENGILALAGNGIYTYDTASGFTQHRLLPDGVSAAAVACDDDYLYLNVLGDSLLYGDLLVLDRQNGYQTVVTVSQ